MPAVDGMLDWGLAGDQWGRTSPWEGERISHGTAENMAERTFSSLSVLLAEAAPRPPRRTPGLPDEAFLRGKVPMTKQEIRSAILTKLAVTPQDICWDVGAGTGSVSVELALQGRSVWAVERQAEACELIRKNRAKFSAWNLHLQEGTAPEACETTARAGRRFCGGQRPAAARNFDAGCPPESKGQNLRIRYRLRDVTGGCEMLGRTWVPSRRHTDLRQPGQVSGASASASGTESGFFNYGGACMKRLMISCHGSGSGKTY